MRSIKDALLAPHLLPADLQFFFFFLFMSLTPASSGNFLHFIFIYLFTFILECIYKAMQNKE